MDNNVIKSCTAYGNTDEYLFITSCEDALKYRTMREFLPNIRVRTRCNFESVDVPPTLPIAILKGFLKTDFNSFTIIKAKIGVQAHFELAFFSVFHVVGEFLIVFRQLGRECTPEVSISLLDLNKGLP